MKSIFQCKRMFLLAGVLAAAVGLSSNAHAWSHNEHNTNNSGATAYDVVKILDGDYQITEMMEWDFMSHNYYHRCVNGRIQTVLRWWNGQVPPGEQGDVCFTARPLNNSAPHAEIVGAWWTDENGVPIGDYIPAASAGVRFEPAGDGWMPMVEIENKQAAAIEVNVDNPNRWIDGDFELIGEARPVPVQSIHVGVVPGALNPRTLTIENLTEKYNYLETFQRLAGPTEIPYGETILLQLDTALVVRAGESLIVVVEQEDENFDLFNFEAPNNIADGTIDQPHGDITASVVTDRTAIDPEKAGMSLAALLLVMTGVFFVRRRYRQSND